MKDIKQRAGAILLSVPLILRRATYSDNLNWETTLLLSVALDPILDNIVSYLLSLLSYAKQRIDISMNDIDVS